MQDGLQAVNALVEQEAAKLKDTQQQQNQQSGETAEEKAAREEKEKNTGTETPEEKAAREAKEKQPDPVDELLKETKFNSLEELKQALAEKNDKAGKTPDQIKKDEEVYQAKLKAYAVENDLMKSDDLQRYDTVKSSSDEDLVFSAFATEMKDEILEGLDEDATEEEIIAAIRKEFENEYPLNSKSDKVKARAEAKLKKAADEIRSPLESSFNTAKTRFDDETSVRNEYPKYQAAIKKMTADIVPDTFSFYKEVDGEEEVKADVEVPEATKKIILDAVEEIVKDPENFLLHKNGKTEEVQQKINSRVEYLMWKHLGEEGKKKIAEVYFGRGLAKGETGAKNSFATNQGGGAKPADNTGLSAEQQVMESTRKK